MFREIAVKRLNEARMRSCRLGFDEDRTDFAFRIAGLAEDALHRFVAACETKLHRHGQRGELALCATQLLWASNDELSEAYGVFEQGALIGVEVVVGYGHETMRIIAARRKTVRQNIDFAHLAYDAKTTMTRVIDNVGELDVFKARQDRRCRHTPVQVHKTNARVEGLRRAGDEPVQALAYREVETALELKKNLETALTALRELAVHGRGDRNKRHVKGDGEKGDVVGEGGVGKLVRDLGEDDAHAEANAAAPAAERRAT